MSARYSVRSPLVVGAIGGLVIGLCCGITGGADLTAAPTPTPTVTVIAPPVTLPPRTVYVERADRSQVARPTPRATQRAVGSTRLDLRNARLWDEIAKCESGRDWDANRGLYDGGLQFLPSTWRAHRGTDFAPTANRATRAEQITVANRASNGGTWLKPWPVCGKRAAAKFGLAFP